MAVNYNIPLQTQLEYMMQELQGPESATLDAFGSGTAISPQDYAEMFEQKYERSGGEGMGKRRQYALEIFRSIDEGTFENLPDNVQTAFNFFKGQGFTDAQAAGIVGNLQVESFPMINPQAYNPEGGGLGAYGIAQFRGPRLKGLLQYAGKQGENTMDGNAPFGMPLRATMKQDMPQQRGGMMGGIRGLLDYGAQVNPQTGLSRFETFAAALDPLIMPSMRGGEGIRARGAQRVQAGNLNRTIEWLKANGYEDIATMVAQNPQTASNVMSAILSQKIKPTSTFRVATPEEAAQYGAIAGQFDEEGKFYPTQKVDIQSQLKEGERKATGFFGRASSSHEILNTLEAEGTKLRNYLSGVLPFGNYLRTPEGQQYDQAKRDFINAILRQESGAVIGVEEFENAEKQYFPQPGDTTAVIEQKRRNRANAIAGLKVSAGAGAQIIEKELSKQTEQGGFSVTGQVGG